MQADYKHISQISLQHPAIRKLDIRYLTISKMSNKQKENHYSYIDLRYLDDGKTHMGITAQIFVNARELITIDAQVMGIAHELAHLIQDEGSFEYWKNEFYEYLKEGYHES